MWSTFSAWPAIDEIHVAAEPEFLAALHHAQHVRDTALRVGTLSGILGGVAAHLRSTRDALVERLFGPWEVPLVWPPRRWKSSPVTAGGGD